MNEHMHLGYAACKQHQTSQYLVLKVSHLNVILILFASDSVLNALGFDVQTCLCAARLIGMLIFSFLFHLAFRILSHKASL